MEIQLNLGGPDQTASILAEAVRTQILNDAVKAITTQLTPDKLEIFLQNILQEGLKDLSGWKMREAVSKHAEPIMADILSKPETQAMIRSKVEEGIKTFMDGIPALVNSKLENHFNTMFPGVQYMKR